MRRGMLLPQRLRPSLSVVRCVHDRPLSPAELDAAIAEMNAEMSELFGEPVGSSSSGPMRANTQDPSPFGVPTPPAEPQAPPSFQQHASPSLKQQAPVAPGTLPSPDAARATKAVQRYLRNRFRHMIVA